MKVLSPEGLWLLVLAIPVILLYMLKLRRKQVQVSSTFLWTSLLRDKQANAPWQRLRRNLLLFLQLLALAALVLVIARPAINVPSVASGSVIVLMDASASMNATDVKPSRFEAARRTVQTLIDNLKGDSSMTIILVSHTPEVLAASESDKTILRDALAKATPTQGGVDWAGAFALAAGAGQGSRSVTTLIVSDGGLPDQELPALPGDTLYVPIGATDNNLAITALALRPTTKAAELFAEVTNFSKTDRIILLSFYFGDNLLAARQVDLPANSHKSLTLDELPASPGIYEARITDLQGKPLDSLALDDKAYAVYQTPSARRVLLISKGNLFLEQLLASLPGLQPFRALPDQDGVIRIPKDPFDLYVLDGTYPAQLTTGNLLIINPPANPLFEVGAPFKEVINVRLKEDDLTRFVDWSNIHILQAKTVKTPGWAKVLISTDAGPLVFAGETNGRRIAVLTFDLRESDLPVQVAYPILLSNIIDYLIPRNAFDSTQSLHPGESLGITPPPGVKLILINSPTHRVISIDSGAPNPVFTATDELGDYTVNFIAKDSNAVAYFTVNLFNPVESDIRPRDIIQIGQSPLTASASQPVGEQELWPWFAGFALLLLIVEWQAYHRKQITFHHAVKT